MWPLCYMLGPGFVWSVGYEALGMAYGSPYPTDWIDTEEEAATVKAACMERIRTKLKLKNKGQ